jgi:phosphoribosylformylglycinamidine synthase
MPVYRIFVEKRPEFAVEADGVLSDLLTALRPKGLEGLRILNRYDVEGISEEVFKDARNSVFSEPQVDVTYDTQPETDGHVFAIEYLPGQFDQRADSCAQCIQLITQGERPTVRTARVFILKGKINDEAFAEIKAYLINPVESREASLFVPQSLDTAQNEPPKVKILKNFTNLTHDQLDGVISEFGLAMDVDDLEFCRDYFKDTERRDPTMTEIRMIDTYWSDHCRHTTFLTNIDKTEIDKDYIKKSYERYLEIRSEIYGERKKPITLMDLATIGAKKLKKDGLLDALDESEEINACSVKIKVDVDGHDEDWLLQFKNETHNHPTEIEPFGGAATCLGGAIRDPLSGRSYVYQAMRVTGAADPRLPIEKTMKGKLPQRKIVVGAAHGYSSYGNQIGLATGQVSEVYHPGYVAKRLETGAVVGAVPAKNVVRTEPKPGDAVILLGGRTGRDGCGGATGSSKSHTLESLETCGAEVQKGNAPEERKIQRLFRNANVTKMIKRCNDFGAGGVSVAIGELADGLKIDLSAVPRKYNGLDGTELAISESQERMAVVVSAEDVDRFIKEASKENLEATAVAVVTNEPRMRMYWNGAEIVSLSREFLNSNGAKKHTNATIASPDDETLYFTEPFTDIGRKWNETLSDLNICSQKGLVDRFDSTIGASTVLMPYGGVYQLTPTQAMAAKIPVLSGSTSTCSLMSWGFNPYLCEKSPYHGAMMSVIESVARLIAAGGSRKNTWLSMQEFFERLGDSPVKWGKPMAALLGALDAQLELGVAAIGGKDSMSGTFENIDVPPTLISFACGVSNASRVMSPEFKDVGDKVMLLRPKYNKNGVPDFHSLRKLFDKVEKLIAAKKVKAVWALSGGSVAEGISKMAFGNKIGFKSAKGLDRNLMFDLCYGAFIVETDARSMMLGTLIGTTSALPVIEFEAYTMNLSDMIGTWQKPLEEIFPTRTKTEASQPKVYSYTERNKAHPKVHISSPRVLIPVFPGTNCEYDSARQFEQAGAVCETFVVSNLSSQAVEESVLAFEKQIKSSQIIMIPGGFSGGDEPDGSGKFITAFFRNPRIKEAVTELLTQRDGLMLGICNGFQALIKLGLVPYGEIRDMDDSCPTLTFNSIGRHQSTLVRTRVASVKSPWLAYAGVGDVFTIPVSHGEGRFVASQKLLAELAEKGQIATQYVDLGGKPSMDISYNPNASIDAIEGITSPDGRVFGKMAHSERIGKYVAKNVDGNKDQRIFAAGVDYFAI